MTDVDVVVPCYQYGRFLRECVGSVLRQGIDDLRVLIVDNASTDDSVAVARELQREDGRVEIVARSSNRGPHASWNEGIDWAKAEYMVILAADDLLADGAIARAISALEKHPNAALATGRDVKFFDGERPPTANATAADWRLLPGHEFIAERCRSPHHYTAGSMVVRTAMQKRAGHYRAALPHTDDLEMLLRLSTLGDAVVTDAIQGIRREHGSNRYNQFWDDRLSDLVEREAAFDSFFALEGRALADASRLRKVAKRRLADWAYWSAMSNLARGQVAIARSLFKFAIERFPGMAVIPPIGYIMRMENPWSRVGNIFMEGNRSNRSSVAKV